MGYENTTPSINNNNEIQNQQHYIIHPPQLDSRMSSIPTTTIPLPTVPAASAAAAVLAASSPTTSTLASNQQGNKILAHTFHFCFMGLFHQNVLIIRVSTRTVVTCLIFSLISSILEQYPTSYFPT